MANFGRDKNGKTLPKSKFPSIRVREKTKKDFESMQDRYDLTANDLLILLMEKKSPNGNSNSDGRLTSLEKLLEDFQKGEGIFG